MYLGGWYLYGYVGLMDEIKIYDHAMNAMEVARAFCGSALVDHLVDIGYNDGWEVGVNKSIGCVLDILPPGIAKQVAPAGLRSRVRLPDGYEIIEVGLDVLLVEIATSIVHDVLMDVVR